MSNIIKHASSSASTPAPLPVNLTTGTDIISVTQDNAVVNGYVDIDDKVDIPNDFTSTFTPGDVIKATGNNDTLSLASDSDTLPTGANVSGFQTLAIASNTVFNHTGTFTADVSASGDWVGLQNLNIFEWANSPITVITGAKDLNVNISTDSRGFSGHATSATFIGSGTLHVNAASLSNLQTIDASGFTGTMIADLTNDQATSYKGGSGNDTVLISVSPGGDATLDGGAGANSLQVDAGNLGILTASSMKSLQNFQTLQVAAGFTEGGTLDLSAVSPFFSQVSVIAGATDMTVKFGEVAGAIVSGSGSLTLDVANDATLTSINAVETTGKVTANLSGDNAAFMGGSGGSFVTIDHDPTAAIDGGTGTNLLQTTAGDFAHMSAAGLSHVSNFQTLLINGDGLVNGGNLDLSAAAAGHFGTLRIDAGANDQTIDIHQTATAHTLSIGGSGSITLSAANTTSLTSIDMSGVSGDITADLSGDNAEYLGGSGNNTVTIDHDPVASIDAGTGTGANVMRVAADVVGNLSANGMSNVRHFQTLDIASGFTNGQTLNVAGAAAGGFSTLDIEAGAAANLTVDLGQASGFGAVNITDSGALTLKAANASSLSEVTLKGGVSNTIDTVDLSGTNASFKGGAEADIVLIDHVPTGRTLDGGGFGSSDTLAITGNDIDISAYTADALKGVSHFGTFAIDGTFQDGKTFDASAISGNVTQFEIEGSDAVTGPNAQGIVITNAASSVALKIVASPGAPITYDGGTTPTIILESLTQGGDISAAVANHTASSVTIASQELDFFNTTNHLAADFTNATSLTITSHANLDLTGSSLAKVSFIDDSAAHGKLTVDISTANETVKLGVGGAVLGNAAAGTVIDLGITHVDVTNAPINGAATLGDAVNSGADLQTSLNNAMVGKGHVAWFQFGGNTYVVEDVSGGSTFINSTDTSSGTTDMVVELKGLVDLTNAHFNTAHSIMLG